MSLLVRLLTTGRSLVDLKSTAGQYRMRRQNRLPKFGSKKNPFAARTETPAAAPIQPAPVQTDFIKPELSPAEVAAANLKKTMRLPVIAVASKPAPAAAPADTAAVKPKAPGRISRWVGKLNPLAWLPQRKAAGTSAIPKFSRPPVQGELSLDKVKVVRNDLSDADVEIVPAKPAARKPPKPVVQEVETRAETIAEAKRETKANLAEVQAG